MQREREEKIDLVANDSKADDAQSSDAFKSAADLPDFGDQYETLELIGQGGMGSVYKVQDKLGTCFAIKLLKPDLAKDKTSVKRFEKEAEATSRLTHEHLVTVYDHGCTSDGTPFIVMEFLGEKTLADVIKERSHLNSSEAIEVFKQICDALSYAHKHGVIHRDLKPSNILVSEDLHSDSLIATPGKNAHSNLKIKVTDFGIASVAVEGAPAGETLTKTGDIVGSPLYMSPEQCQGQSLDARSDIYSFGCVMYTTLTGHAPFEGANPVQIILKQIQESAPPFPPGVRNRVNKELEAIIHNCLIKDKTLRYKSVNEIKADLERVAAGGTVKKHRSLRSEWKAYKGIAITVCSIAPLLLAFCFMQPKQPPAPVEPQVKTTSPIANDLTAERALKHFKARQFDEAIPLLQYVAATAKREGKLEFEAFIYQCIGQSYLALKQYDKAEIEYQKSIKMFGELRHSNNDQLQNDGVITEATTGYIEVLRALNKPDEAMQLLKSMNLQRLRELEDFYQSFPPADLKRVHDLRVELETIRAAEGKSGRSSKDPQPPLFGL